MAYIWTQVYQDAFDILASSWEQRTPGLWSVAGGVAAVTNAAVPDEAESAVTTQLLRPRSEMAVNQKVIAVTAPLTDTQGDHAYELVFRVQDDAANGLDLQSFYAVSLRNDGTLSAGRYTRHQGIDISSTGGGDTGGFAMVLGHSYTLEGTATGIWRTKLTLTVTDNTTGATRTATWDGINPALSHPALQKAGRCGIGYLDFFKANNRTASFDSVTIYKGATDGALTAPTDIVGLSSNRLDGIRVATQEPTGGTAPYTYRWQRKVGNGAWTNLAGQTAPYCADRLAPLGISDYSLKYRCQITDAVGATVTTGEGANSFQNSPDQIVQGGIVSMGTSITFGMNATGYQGAWVRMQPQILRIKEVASTYNVSNFYFLRSGVPGATTADAIKPGYLLGVIEAAIDNKARFFIIEYGTNDAKDSVATSQADYETRIRYIINTIASYIPDAVFGLSLPLGWVVGALDGDLSGNSIVRRTQYIAALRSIANNSWIFASRDAFADFGYAGQTDDGVHPGDSGHTTLSWMWTDLARQMIVPSNQTIPVGSYSSVNISSLDAVVANSADAANYAQQALTQIEFRLPPGEPGEDEGVVRVADLANLVPTAQQNATATATAVLSTPNNKLATNSSGQVQASSLSGYVAPNNAGITTLVTNVGTILAAVQALPGLAAIQEAIRKNEILQRLSARFSLWGLTRTQSGGGSITSDTGRREDGGTTVFAGNKTTGATTITSNTVGTGSGGQNGA